MAQAKVKQFPGFGVVYPDGVNGVKGGTDVYRGTIKNI